MNTKLIIISILALYYSNLLNSQRNKIETDSILNVYERKYRVILNESDYQLIAKQVDQIGTNCQILEDLLDSKQLSNNYKIALLEKFKDWKICSNIILDNIDIFKTKEDNENSFPQDNNDYFNYPIFQTIINDKEYITYFFNYLIESDFLSKCNFLKTKNEFNLKMLSFIFNKSDIAKDQIVNDCKLANLLIIRSYSNQK